MSVIIFLIFAFIIPLIIVSLIALCVSKFIFKKPFAKRRVIYVILTGIVFDFLLVRIIEFSGRDTSTNVFLAALAFYVIGSIVVGILVSQLIDRRFTRQVIIVALGISFLSCLIGITPFIAQEYAEHAPDHSTDFQEYGPTANLANLKVTTTRLNLLEEPTFYNKSLSFNFSDKNVQLSESQQTIHYTPSCQGYVTAFPCQIVTTGHGVTYVVIPWTKTNEEIDWHIGNTNFVLEINNGLVNTFTTQQLSSFIGSFRATHYNSIPLVFSKPFRD